MFKLDENKNANCTRPCALLVFLIFFLTLENNPQTDDSSLLKTTQRRQSEMQYAACLSINAHVVSSRAEALILVIVIQ